MLIRPRSVWPTASTLQTAPAAEPISITEAKNHLRVDTDDDFDLITSLVKVARTHVEKDYRWALIEQTWDAYYGGWPSTRGAIILPRPPLSSVTEVEYTDEDGNAATLAASTYNVDTDSFPGRIVLKRNQTWPDDVLDTSNPIRVRFVAGYGTAASDVPEGIRHALLLIIAELYEHRTGAITGTVRVGLPYAARTLLDSYRAMALA